jgi:hypothetical protein
LETGDTFFMNKNFCSLVENARSTIPDDIEFEMSWVHSPQGWMWIEVPFEVPNPELQNPGLEDPVIRAKLEGLVSGSLPWDGSKSLRPRCTSSATKISRAICPERPGSAAGHTSLSPKATN